jgi:hypothetical protein
MNSKEIKHLAEAHYFTGKKLTDEEYNLLKESKYSHLIALRSEFDTLLEDALPEATYELPESYTKKKRKRHGFYVGVNRGAINHLIDMVEDHFNLGIDNVSTRKYAAVDLDELKSYILKYADDENLSGATIEQLRHVTNKGDVYDVLKSLYMLG